MVQDTVSRTIPVRDIPRDHKISPDVLNYVSRNSASYYQFVPIGQTDGVLEVGMLDPNNLEARDALQFIASKLGLPYKIFQISQVSFDNVLQSYEGLTTQVSKALSDLDVEIKTEAEEVATVKKAPIIIEEAKIIEEAPVTKIVAVILQHATSGNASDIHIEPVGDKVKVRFRVDGALYTSLFLPGSVHDAVVARIKILTNMKLDERRKPQDGRFSARIEDRKIDFRVSTLPTYFGEKVVIRILDPEKTLLTLPSLGLNESNLNLLRAAAKRPYGLILVTGPTGSGKTTTLYAFLGKVSNPGIKVVTIEDPIEYHLDGIVQTQVSKDYTFAEGLRSTLRQDPDVIMVGEIRDAEVASTAVNASLTGHLVFSTLHTNDAAGTFPRLIDMGVNADILGAALTVAMAQRLVRRLCEFCRVATPMSADEIKTMEPLLRHIPHPEGIPANRDSMWIAKGCEKCGGIGYKGRIGVVEVILMDKAIEETVRRTSSEREIWKASKPQQIRRMAQDGAIKVLQGVTSLDELGRVVDLHDEVMLETLSE